MGIINHNISPVVKTEDPDAGVAEILAALTETYLLGGIESWSLADAKGKPLEPSKAAIREHLLSRPEIAMTVGDAADELYSQAVLLPLVARAQSSSPPTPTAASTSAATVSTAPRQRRSRPSSTITTPTDGTETTSPSPAGDSSSSPSSA